MYKKLINNQKEWENWQSEIAKVAKLPADIKFNSPKEYPVTLIWAIHNYDNFDRLEYEWINRPPIKTLIEEIQKVYDINAYHIKRGFKIQDQNLTGTSNHLIEEVVELQGAILENDKEQSKQEAADVLLVYLHMLRDMGFTLDEIAEVAQLKLWLSFTPDLKKVKTKKPGFSRTNRAEE